MESTSNEAYIGEPLSAVLANEQDYLEEWKASLNFTGQNPVFPVEMFIELMEHKYWNLLNKVCDKETGKRMQPKICEKVLSHIYENDGSAASIWKRHVLSKNDVLKLSWSALKKDLFKNFALHTIESGTLYSMQEKLLLLNSLVKSVHEEADTFCIRVNLVTTILQNGKFCWSIKPSQDWAKLLFLFGLSEDERSLIIQDVDNIQTTSEMSILLTERKKCSELATFGFPCVKEIQVYPPTSYTKLAMKDEEILPLDTETIQPTKMSNVTASIETPFNIFEECDQESIKPCIKTEDCETPSSSIESENIHQEELNSCFTAITKPTLQRNRKEKLRKYGLTKRKPKTQCTTCFLCDKNFPSLSLLKDHYSQNHPESKPTKCPMCEFSRMDRRLVIVHLQRNHVEQNDEKPFVCSIATCEKSFKRNDQLSAHKRLSHEGGQKYQCHLCGHRCDYKKRLQEHINAIHTKEKPFKCEKCNFATSWRTQLTQHLWCVHGEGKGSTYTCDLCGYSTKRQGKYKNHLMNIHNIGVKSPAICSICGRSFKTKNYLMDHMYKVHKKTMAGKDTKAALKEKSIPSEIPDTNFLEVS